MHKLKTFKILVEIAMIVAVHDATMVHQQQSLLVLDTDAATLTVEDVIHAHRATHQRQHGARHRFVAAVVVDIMVRHAVRLNPIMLVHIYGRPVR